MIFLFNITEIGDATTSKYLEINKEILHNNSFDNNVRFVSQQGNTSVFKKNNVNLNIVQLKEKIDVSDITENSHNKLEFMLNKKQPTSNNLYRNNISSKSENIKADDKINKNNLILNGKSNATIIENGIVIPDYILNKEELSTCYTSNNDDINSKEETKLSNKFNHNNVNEDIIILKDEVDVQDVILKNKFIKYELNRYEKELPIDNNLQVSYNKEQKHSLKTVKDFKMLNNSANGVVQNLPNENETIFTQDENCKYYFQD